MKHKRVLYILIIVGIFLANLSKLHSVGVGIILGEPTGISVRFDNFPVLGFAWSLENYFSAHCDWWILNSPLINPFNYYIGVGGKIFLNQKTFGMGVRVPLGLEFFPLKPLELFIEIAPGISLLPATEFDIDGGIGLRFHF